MKMTARAWARSTHKGERDVFDVTMGEGQIEAKGAGLEVKLATAQLSLCGKYQAKLHLEWSEIELLARMAAGVTEEQRYRLMVTEIETLKAEMEYWQSQIRPSEDEE